MKFHCQSKREREGDRQEKLFNLRPIDRLLQDDEEARILIGSVVANVSRTEISEWVSQVGGGDALANSALIIQDRFDKAPYMRMRSIEEKIEEGAGGRGSKA